MLRVFHFLLDKYHLRKSPKEGVIQEQFDTGYDSLLEIHEEWKKKSVQDNCYYLVGSSYFKNFIEEGYPPELIQSVLLKRCLEVDEREPRIPLEVGEMLENLSKTPGMRIGMHRSDAILSPPLEDFTLHQILTEGLINNGAAMQGIISSSVPYPSQTITPASDMLMACSILKSSFKGSKGAVLVQLPKEIVDLSLDFQRGVDQESIYEKRGKIYYLKPEYIIGFIDQSCKYYSKEELLENYKQKEI